MVVLVVALPRLQASSHTTVTVRTLVLMVPFSAPSSGLLQSLRLSLALGRNASEEAESTGGDGKSSERLHRPTKSVRIVKRIAQNPSGWDVRQLRFQPPNGLFGCKERSAMNQH